MSAAAFDLSGKVAVVTGGSSGIGAQMGRALGEAGASVVLLARREAELRAAAQDIADAGGEAAFVACDLADLPGLGDVAEACVEPFGPPHILVNAAGINLRQPIDEVSLDTWQRTLDLNLSCPFFLSRALAAGMLERGWGRILNVASLQSVRAFPNSAPYGASKGGIAQLTRALAEAWSGRGICVNAIAPGFFPTELTAPVFGDAARAKALADKTFIGRNGRLDDLDGVTVFLASEASAYITGQTLFVDGGFSAG